MTTPSLKRLPSNSFAANNLQRFTIALRKVKCSTWNITKMRSLFYTRAVFAPRLIPVAPGPTRPWQKHVLFAALSLLIIFASSIGRAQTSKPAASFDQLSAKADAARDANQLDASHPDLPQGTRPASHVERRMVVARHHPLRPKLLRRPRREPSPSSYHSIRKTARLI